MILKAVSFSVLAIVLILAIYIYKLATGLVVNYKITSFDLKDVTHGRIGLVVDIIVTNSSASQLNIDNYVKGTYAQIIYNGQTIAKTTNPIQFGTLQTGDNHISIPIDIYLDQNNDIDILSKALMGNQVDFTIVVGGTLLGLVPITKTIPYTY